MNAIGVYVQPLMLGSWFTPEQQLAIASAVVLAAGAVVLHARGQVRMAIGSLTLAALVLRLFAAFLDPYLHDWDEVFHAVVAKHMITHPFEPQLHTESAMPVSELCSRPMP